MGPCLGCGHDTARGLRDADESVFDNIPCQFALVGTRERRVRADACRPAHLGTHLLHQRTRGSESVRSVRDSFENAMEGSSPDYDMEHERVLSVSFEGQWIRSVSADGRELTLEIHATS